MQEDKIGGKKNDNQANSIGLNKAEQISISILKVNLIQEKNGQMQKIKYLTSGGKITGSMLLWKQLG